MAWQSHPLLLAQSPRQIVAWARVGQAPLRALHPGHGGRTHAQGIAEGGNIAFVRGDFGPQWPPQGNDCTDAAVP